MNLLIFFFGLLLGACLATICVLWYGRQLVMRQKKNLPEMLREADRMIAEEIKRETRKANNESIRDIEED